ncbi:MAG: creatininase family protein [Acidobacteria bacterium]|nr:creatininase family protein [Acidobacteriota bacterium]
MKPICLTSALALLLLGRAAAAGQAPAPVKLEDLTHPEIQQRAPQVLLLPIGSTEPHANHLCYGNDAFTAGSLAARAVERASRNGARVLVLPVMPYGVNTNLIPIPLAQSIRPATMIQFVHDVVDTAEKQGVRKVLILNTHGGNKTTLGTALRELAASHPKVFVALVQPGDVYAEVAAQVIERRGDHASEAETSLALALFPEKVDMRKAVPPREAELKLGSLRAGYLTFVRPWKHVSDNTGVGDPTRATADKGRKLVEIFVDRIASFLKELSDAELSDTFPY